MITMMITNLYYLILVMNVHYINNGFATAKKGKSLARMILGLEDTQEDEDEAKMVQCSIVELKIYNLSSFNCKI